MELPFRDIIDIIIKYHNGQAWAMMQDPDDTFTPTIKAQAAREIINKIKDALPVKDKETFNKDLQAKYKATRESLYFAAQPSRYPEVGE